MRIKFIELFLAVLCVIALVNAAYAKTYTAKDIERLKAFADAGDPVAMNELGLIYSSGYNKLKNMLLAKKYYKISAQLGDIAAKSNLGYLLNGQFEKFGIKPDYDKSVKLIKEAIAEGYLFAYVNLGIAYDDGLGVPKNPALAEKYYKLAAEAGVVEGQFDLAYFYMHQKNIKCYYWYQKAIENKYANAYPYMAMCYLYEVGIEKNLPMAYMYAKYGELCGAQGGKKTVDLLVLPNITPAEKAEGEKLLKEYIAKHPINND